MEGAGKLARLGLAAALFAACLGAGCGGGGRPAGSQLDLVIGDLVPMRGDLAQYGPAGRKAVDLAVQQVRRAIRRSGANIRISVRHADTETNNQIAEIVARQLVQDRHASCLVGDWTSSGTFALGADIAAHYSVPLISPAATNPELSQLDARGFVFRTAPSDDLQARALAVLMARSLGGARGRSVSVAARNDAYGSHFARSFAEIWQQMGGSVQGPVLYDPGLLHHRADAHRILAGRPDATLIIDFPESFARLAPDLLRVPGFDPARLFVPSTMAVPDVRQSAIPPAAVQGARGVTPGTSAPTAAGRLFDRLFARSAERPAAQMPFDAQAFDAATLCFLGAVAANSTNGGAIAHKLASVSAGPGAKLGPAQLRRAVELLRSGAPIQYQGAAGPIDLDSHGDPRAGAYRAFDYSGGKMTGGATFIVKD